MNLIKEFDESLENWESKLQEDEWYFVNLREKITSNLKPNQAFDLIPDVVELVLKQNGDFSCLESFQLLLDVIHVSDTMEIHAVLNAKWDILCNHVVKFGDYHTEKVSELKRWYCKM